MQVENGIPMLHGCDPALVTRWPRGVASPEVVLLSSIQMYQFFTIAARVNDASPGRSAEAVLVCIRTNTLILQRNAMYIRTVALCP
jgi:hypothetical protein